MTLSLEQLACIQAELEMDPSKAARIFANNGIDAAGHQRQMAELEASFQQDESRAQRFAQLRDYYRAVLGPR